MIKYGMVTIGRELVDLTPATGLAARPVPSGEITLLKGTARF
jgi:hypothetical protein